MIIDVLSNSARYSPLSERFARAFAFLQKTHLASLALGTHEIEGKMLYAMVQSYATKAAHAGKWEVHRAYIDIQYVVDGEEQIGYVPADRLVGSGYNPEKDVEFLSGVGDRVGAIHELPLRESPHHQFPVIHKDMFMILWPGEAHMPGMAIGDSVQVKKIVIKIAV